MVTTATVTVKTVMAKSLRMSKMESNIRTRTTVRTMEGTVEGVRMA